MKRDIACSFFGLLLLMLICSRSSAVDVLDQSNVVAPSTTSIVSLAVDVTAAAGQTVRLGIAGTLSRVKPGSFV